MKIVIASDHAGFQYKEQINRYLKEKGFEVIDIGPFNEESIDYPDTIHPAAEKIEKKEADKGIILCGSGQGAAITANKHKGVRAALSWNTEIAKLARLHNDANVLTFPARFVSIEEIYKMIDVFLETKFEGGRHQKRVDKI